MIQRRRRAVFRGPLVVGLVAAIGTAALFIGGCGSVRPPASSPVTSPAAPSPAASTSPVASPVATPATPQALLDTARQAYGAPGAIALVGMGDEHTFVASGEADTSGTPITPNTRFRIASITKPIVAALVLDAVARREVGLDDMVGDVLPGVLRPEPPVTVHQLLDHTSGIFDESNGIGSLEALEADIARLADPALRAEATIELERLLAGKRVIASDRLVVALSETHDRLFKPGTGFAYSNTNYQVAAMVLEQATGMSLSELLQERIVVPLELTRMSIAPPDITSPELRGYTRNPTDGSLLDLTDDLSWFGNGGNGGILSTAEDLLTIMQAVAGGAFLPEDLTTAMLTPSRGSYGLGIGGYRFRCGVFFGHQGGVNGTASIAVASADGERGAVIAFNLRDGADPDLVGLAEELLCSDDQRL